MKKGFTIIELIFVVVILGILAAVAIPKLNEAKNGFKKGSVGTVYVDQYQTLSCDESGYAYFEPIGVALYDAKGKHMICESYRR